MILVILLMYHSLNIYTDLRFRRTKNLWHLLFLVGAIPFIVRTCLGLEGMEILAYLFWGVLLWLLLGLFLETFRFFSPGDTKMLLVSGIWITSTQQGDYVVAGYAFAFFTTLFLFCLGLYYFLKNNAIHTLWLSLRNRLPIKVGNMPGALPIALGTWVAVLVLAWFH
ncbi:hypothetical protein [Caldalkalibacillus mannanilyticus]|uniref:hypothetical protein n=1 Tax=Caldalkalibacillus mannanilyticus TaxID=1418 RepID=UPI0011DD3783|nr:hypothetical protein [Caldalkalibacillus mannanilyticus]